MLWWERATAEATAAAVAAVAAEVQMRVVVWAAVPLAVREEVGRRSLSAVVVGEGMAGAAAKAFPGRLPRLRRRTS